MAKVYRAGAGETTSGEEKALQVLAGLPKSWSVIANKILAMDATNSFEIDFIVIGPHRIVILDEKSFGGIINGSDEVWTLNSGASIRSPFGKIDMIARKLAGLVDKKVVGFPQRRAGVVPVVGGIMLSSSAANAQIRDIRASRCLLTRDNAIDKLTWLDGEAKEAGFDLTPISTNLVRALYNDNRSQRPRRPSRIGLFTIEDEVDERSGCRVFLAKDEESAQRMLFVYPFRAINDPAQTTLDRELQSLKLLQSTGIVPRIGESFLWSDDDYRVIPVYLPAGSAIGAMPTATSQQASIREIEAAAASFQALHRVHEKGIVHRAIRPDVVYIDDPTPPQPNAREAQLPQATITGFVSAHIDHTATIVETLDQGGFDDPYAAPEIVQMGSYGFADATSDVYSLSLLVLERLAAAPLAHLLRNDVWRHSIDRNAGLWPFLSEASIDALRESLAGGLTRGSYDNESRSSAAQMATDLARIAREARMELPWEKGPVPGTDLEIKTLLGEGSSARTYLLYDTTNDRSVAGKEYFRPGALEEAIREFNLLFDHQHRNLPKVVGKPDKSRPHFQILLEFIDGEDLRALIPVITHDRDLWKNLMNHLLGAVEHLEQHGLLHRDIKPENIMIRDADGCAFLIDYGASAPVEDPGVLAGSPRYWPPEWKQGTGFPVTSDRYAVAVTLYEALTGELPFKTIGASFHGALVDRVPESLPGDLHEVAQTLLKALSLAPQDRFASSAELRLALNQALEMPVFAVPSDSTSTAEETKRTSNWINSVRGLFRNSKRGNADNRGLETEFARTTYVRTELDATVGPAVAKYKPAVVFLSGNPGDGKTAFLEQVLDALEDSGAALDEAETDLSGWEASLGGHTFRACFDASESANGKSADQQLAHRMRGHHGGAPDRTVTVLVAINDGRLAEMHENLRASFPWLIDEIDRVRNVRGQVDIERDPVWVIDLKQRSYVALNADPTRPSVMRQMLTKLVEESRWPASQSESYRPRALENAASLRVAGADAPAERLEWLLALAHLRGDRHMTVRDLRSALAYLITYDLDPREEATPPHSWTGKYWNTLFTTDGTTDLVLGELKWLDPARFAHPELERFLYFRHRPEDEPVRARLFANGIDEPPPAGTDPAELSDWIDAVKRRLVLEGAANAADLPLRFDPIDLQPYRIARELFPILNGDVPASTLLSRVLRGIGRSDGIDEARRTDDLVLRVKKSEEYDIEIVKQFPREEFTLGVVSTHIGSLIETIPRTLTLSHGQSGARVRLNLDVIEILVRLADGLDPASQELGSLLEELLPFKSRVQRNVTQRLLLIEGNRKHWIERRDNRLVRTDA